MKVILILLIFCLVLFFYLHIYSQLKTSNELEVYEIEHPSKERLEEICELKQPVIFTYDTDKLCMPMSTLQSTYNAFDVKIRNVKYMSNNDEIDLYIPIALNKAIDVMNADKESKYFSEKNSDFLKESGLIKKLKYNDMLLRPYMVSNCIYDYLIATKGTQTPFRYELNYRNYFLVNEGEIKIKLAPPKSVKYLSSIKDYEYFEFRSPINPWDIQLQYKPDFDKIKCLEIVLKKGQLFYLPPYWWYSIEFSSTIVTSICSFKYRTFMNTVAIIDKLIIQFLQLQNIKRKKKV
jgi:hypothetical protein